MAPPSHETRPWMWIYDLPVNVRTGRAHGNWDFKDLKDTIRHLIDEHPEWVDLTCDHRIAYADFKTFKIAFQAFERVNGYNWNGTILNAILCYPDGMWLVHPRTNAETATPLLHLVRASGQQSRVWVQSSFHSASRYGETRQRHSSFSSTSTQASSSGGFSPPPTFSSVTSQAVTQIGAHLRTQVQDILHPVVADTNTGALSSHTDPKRPSHGQPDRYQIFRCVQAYYPSHYPPARPDPAARLPSYDYTVEHRKIIIRELGVNVTEQQLLECLISHQSEGQCTIRRNPDTRRCCAFVEYPTTHQAVQAVRRLNGACLADRILWVEIASERETVSERRHSRSSTLGSYDSVASSSVTAGSPNANRRHGPIIADGSLT